MNAETWPHENYGVSATLPKIWYSRILTSIELMEPIDCVMPRNDLQSRLEHKRAYFEWKPDPFNDAPIRLEFKDEVATISTSIRDVFIILNGYLVVSSAFRDVLIRFDLGSTQLFEVPIFLSDGVTPSGHRSHYLLHVTETRPTLISEQSKNIRRGVRPGETEPPPSARWKDTYEPDDLAVLASSAAGVDLWADTILQRRLFFSDRLKQAIDAAGLVSDGLDFMTTRVMTDGDSGGY